MVEFLLALWVFIGAAIALGAGFNAVVRTNDYDDWAADWWKYEEWQKIKRLWLICITAPVWPLWGVYIVVRFVKRVLEIRSQNVER